MLSFSTLLHSHSMSHSPPRAYSLSNISTKATVRAWLRAYRSSGGSAAWCAKASCSEDATARSWARRGGRPSGPIQRTYCNEPGGFGRSGRPRAWGGPWWRPGRRKKLKSIADIAVESGCEGRAPMDSMTMGWFYVNPCTHGLSKCTEALNLKRVRLLILHINKTPSFRSPHQQ